MRLETYSHISQEHCIQCLNVVLSVNDMNALFNGNKSSAIVNARFTLPVSRARRA
jgi:hypothetical protein